MPTPSSQLASAEMKIALAKISLSLNKHKKSRKVRDIITAINSLEPEYESGNLNDTLKINEHLRIRMLALLDKSTHQESLYNDLFVSLLILANYWPLNNTRFNHDDGSYEFECPLSGALLDDVDKIVLPTGTQINRQLLNIYLTEFGDGPQKLKDPVTSYIIKNLGSNYLASLDTAAISDYIDSQAYTNYSHDLIGYGGDIGSRIGGLVVAGIMLVLIVLTHFVIPFGIALWTLLGCAFVLPLSSLAGGICGFKFMSDRLNDEQESLLHPDVGLRDALEETLFAVRTQAVEELNASVLIPVAYEEVVVGQSSTAAIVSQLPAVAEPVVPVITGQARRETREVWLKKLEQRVTNTATQSVEVEAKSSFPSLRHPVA